MICKICRVAESGDNQCCQLCAISGNEKLINWYIDEIKNAIATKKMSTEKSDAIIKIIDDTINQIKEVLHDKF